MASPTASQQQKAQNQSSTTASNTPSTSAQPSSSTHGRQKGATNGASGRASKPQSDKSLAAHMPESNTPDKHAIDRLLFLFANFVGNVATITVQNGDKFTGIFSSASVPKEAGVRHQYVLKMAKRQPQLSSQVNSTSQGSDEEYVGYGDDHVVVFDAKDVVHVTVPNVSTDKAHSKMTNGTSASFRTDTGISGNVSGQERELQRWEPSGDAAQDLTFAENGKTSWDQFETNERLYGVKTDYDETFYTTAIDRSAPSYNQRAAAAEKIAREIENSTTTNSHMAEERGQVSEGVDGNDEEDRFSGVKRDFLALSSGQANKYTPPARRAPTGQATVTGAPVDPAIISAQLAKTDGNIRSAKASPLVGNPDQGVKKENIEPPFKNGPPPAQAAVIENSSQDTAASQTQASASQTQAVNGAPRTPDPNLHQILVPSSTKSTVRANPTPTTALPNTMATVERDVLNEFRNFAAREKNTISERHKLNARKEKEVKLNDLKKFAASFKLKTVVPTDMLGILAKDKQKQLEIVEKSQRQLTEQQDAAKTAGAGAEKKVDRQTPDLSAGEPQKSSAAQTGRQNGKTVRSTQPLQTSFNGRTSQPLTGPILSPRAGPGNLGPRLLQQQQLRDRALQSFSGPSAGAAAFGSNSRNGSISNSTAAARLNVQASEFRPNPAATTFSPSVERSNGPTSPLRTKTQQPPKPTNRTSFFSGKRPSRTEKKSINDGFNPIARMNKEVQAQNLAKNYAANGGIPQPYRTPPTWDTTPENKDRSYIDMFEKPFTPGPAISPVNMQMAHQHQLPLHLQGPQHGPQLGHHPQFQAYPQQLHGKGTDHRFDDHRMQFSGSQSSQYPSPRMPMPQVMMPFSNHAVGQMTPQMAQTIGPFPYGANPQLRQYPAQFIGTPNMAPMVLQPGGVPFMTVPMHSHTPVFPGAQAHMVPAHIMGQHTPGPSAYSSPRGAHLMMHQGSQQGHVPPQIYMSPGQHPSQMYTVHGPQTSHMRGGVPMVQQQSFGGPQQYPVPQRQYSQMSNNYAMQSAPMDRGMSQQQQPQQQQHQQSPQVQVAMSVAVEREENK